MGDQTHGSLDLPVLTLGTTVTRRRLAFKSHPHSHSFFYWLWCVTFWTPLPLHLAYFASFG